jgi:hypothetical protein
LEKKNIKLDGKKKKYEILKNDDGENKMSTENKTKEKQNEEKKILIVEAE